MFCIHLGPVLVGTAVQGPEILYIIIQRISYIPLIMLIPCETMLTHPTNFMDILCSTSEVSMICTNSSKEMRVSCKRHINVIPDPDLWNRFRSNWLQHHRHLFGLGNIKEGTPRRSSVANAGGRPFCQELGMGWVHIGQWIFSISAISHELFWRNCVFCVFTL